MRGSRSSVALSFKRASARSLLRAGASACGRSGKLFVWSLFMTIAAGGVGVFSKWGDRFLAEKGAGIILFLIFLIAGILVGVLAASVLKWALAALPRAGVRMVSTGDRLAEETAAQEEAWALDQALPKADGSKKSAIKRL